jgi:SAM-dependent methyltransferase
VRPALAVFGRALQYAAIGDDSVVDLMSVAGDTLLRMDAAHWCGQPRPGDDTIVTGCTGSTLDVGCGPGRLVSALAQRGVAALGIDISGEAIAQARERGAAARLCDVFGTVPDSGWWKHVLLADGNIGIGGHPARLLQRCRRLLRPDGTIIVEIGPPGSGTWRHPVRLRHNGLDSPPFWWAAVATDDLEPIAHEANLAVERRWASAGRWFARLCPQN